MCPARAAHAPAYFGPFQGRCGWVCFAGDWGAAGARGNFVFANIISVIAWEELKTKVECIQAPETLSCCIPWAETDSLLRHTASSNFLLQLLPARPPFTSRMSFQRTSQQELLESRAVSSSKTKRHGQRWLQGLHWWSVVQTPCFQCRAQVGSLVQELRPYKAILCSQKSKRHGSNPSGNVKSAL